MVRTIILGIGDNHNAIFDCEGSLNGMLIIKDDGDVSGYDITDT